MKIVAISDTHGLHDRLGPLPDGDVLVHAGDLTNNGGLKQLRSTTNWLKSKLGQFKHVVAIGGNHDYALEHFMNEGAEDLLRRDFFGDVIYLRDNAVAIGGKKFYGMPWITSRNLESAPDWAFYSALTELKDKVSLIPNNTDVLVTHGPPYGVLDQFYQHRIGSEDLWERVDFVRPAVHIFGHVHNAFGGCTDAPFDDISVVEYRNAAILDVIDNRYVYTGRRPWEIEI